MNPEEKTKADGEPVTMIDLLYDRRYEEREYDSDYYDEQYYYSEEGTDSDESSDEGDGREEREHE